LKKTRVRLTGDQVIPLSTMSPGKEIFPSYPPSNVFPSLAEYLRWRNPSAGESGCEKRVVGWEDTAGDKKFWTYCYNGSLLAAKE